MELNTYQELTKRTRYSTGIPHMDCLNIAIGIAGEAGEIADLVKKWQFHGHNLDTIKVRDELGDLLWYIAWMASLFRWDLSTIAEENIKKLEKRYPDGFSTQDSITRRDIANE